MPYIHAPRNCFGKSSVTIKACSQFVSLKTILERIG